MITKILIFIMVVLVHEIGHWQAAFLYGLNPKIKLRPWGLLCEYSQKNLSIKKHIWIISSGIWWGAIALMFFGAFGFEQDVELIVPWYFISCSLDFVLLLGIYEHIHNKRLNLDDNLSDIVIYIKGVKLEV